MNCIWIWNHFKTRPAARREESEKMPTNRTFKKKRHKGGNAASPSTLATLADPDDLDVAVRLAIRIANPPFDVLSEDAAGIEEGKSILRRLWPQHGKAAAEHCIRRYGVGARPALWWEKKVHPYVRPRDWFNSEDGVCFARERAEADLKYLRDHGYLTREEKIQLAEAGKEKHYGPQSDS
jgi:hypothetical protein